MTNPTTCRHNILTARVTEQLETFIECVSCGVDLTDPEKRIGKNYEYDIDANVWVHGPSSSAVRNRFGVYRRQWVKYCDEESKAGRRYIPFEDWRNEGPQGEIRI